MIGIRDDVEIRSFAFQLPGTSFPNVYIHSLLNSRSNQPRPALFGGDDKTGNATFFGFHL